VDCDAVLAETCIFGNVDKFLPDYAALRPRKVMLRSRRLDNLIPNVTRCDLARIFNHEVDSSRSPETAGNTQHRPVTSQKT